jgi:hypothetical protein
LINRIEIRSDDQLTLASGGDWSLGHISALQPGASNSDLNSCDPIHRDGASTVAIVQSIANQAT